jgi:hypothetical protein
MQLALRLPFLEEPQKRLFLKQLLEKLQNDN